MKHLVHKLFNRFKFFITTPSVNGDLLTLFHALRQCKDLKKVSFNKCLSDNNEIITNTIEAKVLPMVNFDVYFLDKNIFHSTVKEIFILNGEIEGSAWKILADHLELSFNTRINWSGVRFDLNEMSIAGFVPTTNRYIVLTYK